MGETIISVIIEGGKATPGPPLAPALAPLGVNIVQLIGDLNKQTAIFEGTKVPVKVIVDKQTKKWRFEIGSPATSELIKKELKIEKGAKGGEQDPKIVGNLTMEQVIKIAKKKQTSSLSKTLKGTVIEVIGTCLSMGVTVENLDPREIIKKIKKGEYDSVIGAT
ncbi:MAG: 50S ribosomal protein L11 [Candidatus Anstonellaceae archaeon]